MVKKIVSILFSLFLLSGHLIEGAHAQQTSDAKVVFAIDCNTAEKLVKIGLVSNPADAPNGPLIIAFDFTFEVTPFGTTTISDLTAAKLEPNAAYSNMVIAKNTASQVGSVMQLRIAGGFTEKKGVNNVTDLFFVKGINQKAYTIKKTIGEMIPLNSTEDIDKVDDEVFTADPSTCPGAAPTTTAFTAHTVAIENFTFIPIELKVKVGDKVTWTNKDSAPHTVSSQPGVEKVLDSGTLNQGQTYAFTFTKTGTFDYQCNIHPTMKAKVIVEAAAAPTTTTEGETTITITADKTSPKGGETVTVTGLIKNRKGAAIDWSQTSGTQIKPDIKNEELPTGETRSVFTFTMPEKTSDITLRLKVGTATKTITIKAVAAPEAVTPAEPILTLEERLRERREAEAVRPSAEPTTVHAAAGADLTRSGPADTALLILISLGLVYGFRRLRRREASEA